MENVYETRYPEFLPTTPHRTASQSQHCSLSHWDYLRFQNFKSEYPILDTEKAHNYGNYYSEKNPKIVIAILCILSCPNYLLLMKINPLIF